MQVAKAALPQLLQRAERMLTGHAASTSAPSQGVSEAEEEASMEDFQCMLEVLQALTVTPAITDAVLPPEGFIKARPQLWCLSMPDEDY